MFLNLNYTFVFLNNQPVVQRTEIYFLAIFAVAPHTGAWIEICKSFLVGKRKAVAPHTGARIEIR